MKELEFTCKVKGSELNGFHQVYGYEDISVVKKPEFEVKYKLSIDNGDQGIFGIEFTCFSIISSIDLKAPVDEMSDEKINEVKKKVKGKVEGDYVKWVYKLDTTKESWKIVNKVSFKKDGAFDIEFLDIDVDKKVIEIL
jgi:hypothetical protein